MSRSSRNLPKAIAEFGENQFRETGAERVEVLRVKASSIRKLFKQLRGISYLVSVISLDRVRVYFFSQSGLMIGGENINHEQYNKLRKTSRLLSKFEKERPPTPEELRMEATEDLRTNLSKTIRRSARLLGVSEPDLPDIFVTKQSLDTSDQDFGMDLEDDGTIVFEESMLRSSLSNCLLTRASFLIVLMMLSSQPKRCKNSLIQCMGNGFAYSQIKDGKTRSEWYAKWKDSTILELVPFVNHFLTHSETYDGIGFRRILELANSGNLEFKTDTWNSALLLLHNTLEVSMIQDDFHLINRFCSSLSNTDKLAKKKHILDRIHLAPRVVVNPFPLGITISASLIGDNKKTNWLDVNYIQNGNSASFNISEGNKDPISSLDYWLDIADIFPKTAGITSHGDSIHNWIMRLFGQYPQKSHTFEANLTFNNAQLSKTEAAVLERLLEGKLEILSNSLIGSPGIMRSLLERGVITLLPSFNHIGINPDFYVRGDKDELHDILVGTTLEATFFNTDETSHVIVSSPPPWRNTLIRVVSEAGFHIYDIIDVLPRKPLLRFEDTLTESSDAFVWNT